MSATVLLGKSYHKQQVWIYEKPYFNYRRTKVYLILEKQQYVWFSVAEIQNMTGIAFHFVLQICKNLGKKGYAQSRAYNHEIQYRFSQFYDGEIFDTILKRKSDRHSKPLLFTYSKGKKTRAVQEILFDYFNNNPKKILNHKQIKQELFNNEVGDHVLKLALSKMNCLLNKDKVNNRWLYSLRSNLNVKAV